MQSTDLCARKTGLFSLGGEAYWSAHDWQYQANTTGQPFWICTRCGKFTNTDPNPVKPVETITLRDQLAAAALPAIYQHQTFMTDRAADLAYEQADEMLRARNATRS